MKQKEFLEWHLKADGHAYKGWDATIAKIKQRPDYYEEVEENSRRKG